ncbi:MAG: DJ-1/PfpI/YhbO family deglycase/protease [Chloroflexi bacterium]|jgi:protease I|nr:DJ-1/PfpI/YhbO family deglycase/protease [Chloroflexota bacterium]
MNLSGKRAIILAEDLYQDLELWYPLLRLRGTGMDVKVVGTGSASVYTSKYGYPVEVDTTADKVDAKDIDAVVIPGGYAPDRLRRYPAVLKLVREAFEQGKVVAAICHAGWVLISAGIVKGRTVTSFSAIKDDLVNAGGHWVDQEVVQDGNLITSRQPSDLPAFTDAIIAALGGIEAGGLEKVTKETGPLEALRMAIQAEEAAYNFYSMAIQKTNDPEAKNIFHRLAQEEQRHREIVQDEYNRLSLNPDWDRYNIWREVL